MPVADVAISQRPAKSLPSQTLLDDRVLIHIQFVVVVDKLVTQRLAEDHPDDNRQKNADSGNRPAVIQTSRTAFGFQPAEPFYSRHFSGRRSGRARRHGSGFSLP